MPHARPFVSLPCLNMACLLLGASLWSFNPAKAQVLPDTTAPTEDLEAFLEDLDEDTGDQVQLAELLADLLTHPLDINTATQEDFAQIPALGTQVAHNIVAFRETFGPFGSIPEMRSVEGVTESVFLEARPYLTIGEVLDVAPPHATRFAPVPSMRALVRELRFEMIQRASRRLDTGRGYDDDTTRTTYVGSPERLYTRLRARSNRQLSLNLTLEKDPGEAFAWDPATQTYGFDHLTAHLALTRMGRIKTLVAGDFTAEFGQGVALWRSASFGKGREPVRSIARSGRGIVPYGSTDENSFFRGLAADVYLTPSLSVATFISRRTLDASLIEPDTTTDEIFVDQTEASTLAQSGLHRTPTERLQKDAVKESIVGGTVDYQRESVRTGIVAYHSSFDRPFQTGSQPYQRFRFSGEQATMVSVYGNLYLGDLYAFGEVARSPTGVTGGIGGVSMRLDRTVEAVVLARNYPRDFVSLHGFAFGERNGATQNEKGYYVGLTLKPSDPWRFAAYFDQYRFPWVRFGVPRPGTGYDTLLLVEHRPRRWLTVYLQARSETKDAGFKVLDTTGRLLDAVHPETRQSLRLHGDYVFSNRLRLRARIEGVRFIVAEAPDEVGVVLLQDIRWSPLPMLQLDLRLALFDTDSFDSRVFTYENDLLYTFAVPAFSGRGQRAYVLLRWHPFSQLTFQAKASITRFEDVRVVGSGLDEVEGNVLRELRAQLRWRF